MKIGIASDNQVSIAQHFGRTKGFVIAEILAGQVKSKAYRENNFSHHSKSSSHDHNGEHGEHGHSHDSILEALKDCDVVIARGMGRRIYDDLRGAEIESIITDIPAVDDALKAYMSDTIVDNPGKGCIH